MNMGIAPYNITSAVTLVIAQRLARRLHDCKREVSLPEHALLEEGFTAEDIAAGVKIYEAVGCEDCANGYKGRVGIYQVMPMRAEIQRSDELRVGTEWVSTCKSWWESYH